MDSHIIPKKLRHRLGWGVRRAVTLNPGLSEVLRTGKALIIYYSVTGNTRKVAFAIQKGLRKGGLEPTIKKISEAYTEELYDYDLVCFGTPVLHAFVPPRVNRFIRKKSEEYGAHGKRHEIRLPAPKIPGKSALVFVTFSGPHIGKEEALPAGKYIRAFFGHLGFEVKGEWYVVGEFHGWKAGNIRGFLGDIRGRPNAEDLVRIEEKTIKLVKSLKLESKH
ncbi:flavodoxin domain-containing protein [Candidatus Bathyarchaeota archaeon]|nr:flavodoxin domain-containing protein [Candidatus Bathyarchaeota archaeon]